MENARLVGAACMPPEIYEYETGGRDASRPYKAFW